MVGSVGISPRYLAESRRFAWSTSQVAPGLPPSVGKCLFAATNSARETYGNRRIAVLMCEWLECAECLRHFGIDPRSDREFRRGIDGLFSAARRNGKAPCGRQPIFGL